VKSRQCLLGVGAFRKAKAQEMVAERVCARARRANMEGNLELAR
jgi:hypothetical protein